MENNVYVLDPSYINKYVMASKPTYDADVSTTDQNIEEYVELVQVDGTGDVTLNEGDMCYRDGNIPIMYIPYCENGKIVLKPSNCCNEVNLTSARLVEVSLDTRNYVTNTSKKDAELEGAIPEDPLLIYDSTNKVNLSSTINNNFITLDTTTSLAKTCIRNIGNSPRNNSESKLTPLPGYVHDSYRIHKDAGVDSGTQYAQERYMLYSGCKSRLKNDLPKQAPLKMIPPKQFKLQLMDTSDIVTPLKLLPHPKKLMDISEANYNTSLLNPIHHVPNSARSIFTRNCITEQKNDDIDVSELGLQPLGFTRVIDYSKIKRITRKRKNPIHDRDKNVTQYEKIYIADTKGVGVSTTIVPNSNIQLTTHTGIIDNDLDVFLSGNDEESSFLYGGETAGEQIIVIHDGQETAESTAYTHHNIEVLLAAAAEDDSVSLSHQEKSVVAVDETLISNMNQQIIIVGNAFPSDELSHD